MSSVVGELMGLTCSSLMLRLLSCRPATVFVHRLPAFRQPLKAGSLFTLGGLEMAEGVNLEETQPAPFIADIVGKTYSFQVRVGMNNFAANHQIFTISRMNECDCLPLCHCLNLWTR
ncbi:hypothetical protein Bca4012_059952 [Brassica carinata]